MEFLWEALNTSVLESNLFAKAEGDRDMWRPCPGSFQPE
jgi:hypothetical protein